MNLRGIANSITRSVNPNVHAVLRQNIGYTTNDSGERVSSFVEKSVVVQLQTLSSQDLQLFDGLAQQGELIYAYVSAQFYGLQREQATGADKLVFARWGENEPHEWLVKQVVESWADWCKVLLWRQN